MSSLRIWSSPVSTNEICSRRIKESNRRSTLAVIEMSPVPHPKMVLSMITSFNDLGKGPLETDIYP